MNLEHGQLMSTYLNLTRRQREVVYWVQQGLSNSEVAEQLCIAPSVVAGHLTNIYEELSSHNGDDPDARANRYTLIRLFAGFFDQYPEMACF
ncbi:response regulator transcription factor [Aggregatilinea lenta]|uniref:response regulator transcription factor n=1 Tax=Aggregatilinea lenta TaxID=913108 RepID=UPI000E5A7052|nr:helix-turn-helix transcriptional regulator [Aggregatilinea lenta]